MTNTKAADDVSSTTDTFSDDDGPKCAMLTRDEMIRMSKANGEIIGSGTTKVTPPRKFHQTARVASNSTPPFARRLNELSNEVVLLTSKTSALKDEVDKIKKEREGDKKTMEDMTKKIKQYEDERLRKRSINDVTDGAEENLERKCKKRTIIEEY